MQSFSTGTCSKTVAFIFAFSKYRDWRMQCGVSPVKHFGGCDLSMRSLIFRTSGKHVIRNSICDFLYFDVSLHFIHKWYFYVKNGFSVLKVNTHVGRQF